MPGGDRTGPMGAGPMTGRAAGYCAGYPGPGYTNPGFGRGGGAWGWGGRGRGRGWRHWYHATGLPGWARAGYGSPAPMWGAAPMVPWAPTPPSTEQEAEFLRNQANYFSEALSGIQKRLEELEAAKE